MGWTELTHAHLTRTQTKTVKRYKSECQAEEQGRKSAYKGVCVCLWHQELQFTVTVSGDTGSSTPGTPAPR